MNLLDRHIFRSVLATSLMAVGLFAFILMTGNVIHDLMGPLLSGQLQVMTFLRLVLLLLPFVVSYALPLGMLTGVLLTLGRLSSDSEITAMRAAGLSLPRIARPALILGVLGVVLGLRVNFESMPWARVQYHRELGAAVRANPLSFIVPKTFIREFPGFVIYVGTKQGPDLKDIWIWSLDGDRRVVRFIRAESGKVDFDESANEFILTLARATTEEHDRKAPDDYTQSLKIITAQEVDPYHLSLAKFFGAGTVHQKLQWMTYRELLAEKSRVEALPIGPGGAKQHDRDVMKVSLTIQDKITMALSIFSFAFIGVPLGIKVSRRETSANLGVAVALALSYYFLTVMVQWLDHHPEYRPDLLLWMPNLIFLSIGFTLLRRLDRPA